jgi:hypothetical protein
VAVAGSLDNFIGMDGSKAEFNSFDRSSEFLGTKNNRNTFKQTNALAGIYMTSDSVDHDSNAWGTIALTPHWQMIIRSLTVPNSIRKDGMPTSPTCGMIFLMTACSGIYHSPIK